MLFCRNSQAKMVLKLCYCEAFSGQRAQGLYHQKKNKSEPVSSQRAVTTVSTSSGFIGMAQVSRYLEKSIDASLVIQ